MSSYLWADRLERPITVDETADAESWDRCALGEMLGLGSLETPNGPWCRHTVLDDTLHANYPWLQEAGCEFASYIRDIYKPATPETRRKARVAAKALVREMKEYVDDCGGAEAMRGEMLDWMRRTAAKRKIERAEAHIISNPRVRGGD